MLKEESDKLRFIFGPLGDLHSKVSNVGNGIDSTSSPYDLA